MQYVALHTVAFLELERLLCEYYWIIDVIFVLNTVNKIEDCEDFLKVTAA